MTDSFRTFLQDSGVCGRRRVPLNRNRTPLVPRHPGPAPCALEVPDHPPYEGPGTDTIVPATSPFVAGRPVPEAPKGLPGNSETVHRWTLKPPRS